MRKGKVKDVSYYDEKIKEPEENENNNVLV